MEKIVSCGFLIFRKTPQLSFLLMRHADRWDLPKGHVDAGETHLQCANRELFEETGIAASQVDHLKEFHWFSDYEVRLKRFNFKPRPKRLIVFLGVLNQEVEIKPTEHLGCQWFDWHPPHQIQQQVIDPLLKAVEDFFKTLPETNPGESCR